MAKKKFNVAPAPHVEGGDIQSIKLTDIVDNTSQSRGMGVLSNLQAEGWGIFVPLKEAPDNKPLWLMLTGDDQDDRDLAVKMIEEYEIEFAEFAEGIAQTGQLQPIAVREDGDYYDIIYGMRRALALAYNQASLKDQPDFVDARVIKQDFDDVQLRLLSLIENNDRSAESPLEKAMTFRWLKQHGLSDKDIADRVGWKPLNVKVYLQLLDPLLEDKRQAIHTGKLKVDPAIKLLNKRKQLKDPTAEAGRESVEKTDERHRMPGSKRMVKIYESPRKIRGMTDEEWELWITDDVRRFIAFHMGLTYTPYTPPADEPSENGEKLTIKVSHEKAYQLLEALGEDQARTWTDEVVLEKLDNITDIDDYNTETVLDDEELQELLETLVKAQDKEWEVELIASKKKAKAAAASTNGAKKKKKKVKAK